MPYVPAELRGLVLAKGYVPSMIKAGTNDDVGKVRRKCLIAILASNRPGCTFGVERHILNSDTEFGDLGETVLFCICLQVGIHILSPHVLPSLSHFLWIRISRDFIRKQRRVSSQTIVDSIGCPNSSEFLVLLEDDNRIEKGA